MSRSYLIFFSSFLYLNKINVISLPLTLTTLPLEVKIVPSPFLDVFAFAQRPVGHAGRRNSSALRRRLVRGG